LIQVESLDIWVGSLGSTPEYCGVDGIEKKKRERREKVGKRKDSFMLFLALVPLCHSVSGEAEARRPSPWFIMSVNTDDRAAVTKEKPATEGIRN
jgi:hypothetical protein